MDLSRQDIQFLFEFRSLLNQYGRIVAVDSLNDLVQLLNTAATIDDANLAAYCDRLLQMIPPARRVYLQPGEILICGQDDNSVEVQRTSLEATLTQEYIICTCGEVLRVIHADNRAYPRKSVRLSGVCYYGQADEHINSIEVEDLSYTGALIRLSGPHTITYYDRITLHFTLNDDASTVISESVYAKHVADNLIGVEFENASTVDPALATYCGVSWVLA